MFHYESLGKSLEGKIKFMDGNACLYRSCSLEGAGTAFNGRYIDEEKISGAILVELFRRVAVRLDRKRDIISRVRLGFKQ